MANEKKRRRSGFLGNYKLDDAYLLKPDKALGRPGLLTGTIDGDSVLVKVWPRSGKSDVDLEDIWKHELRQLHRLAGYPGALDCIVELRQAGLDDRGFYLILNPGQRQDGG